MSNVTSGYVANQDAEASKEVHGLPCIQLSNEANHALVAKQGGQALSWHDRNGRERLYLSPLTGGIQGAQSTMMEGPAIRGGIPVCFPQFSDRGNLMKHGFARNLMWHAKKSQDHGSAVFRLESNEHTKTKWPYSFCIEAHVQLHVDRLSVALQLTNTDNKPWSFTVALHTYLRVNDVRKVKLSGLHGVGYQDATDGNREVVQNEEYLSILDEVDRVYLAAPDSLVLLENDKQSLQIQQQGFEDTVVWNPGPAKARSLSDFPDDDWLNMLCVEAACAKSPVTLAPGASWSGSQTLIIPT